MARHADLSRPGVWRELFAAALTLTDHLGKVLEQPRWTFGGGTVLMLRLDHRHSKDIDLFVPDPQYLGHLTPRLCDTAEALTHDYVEAAEYLKLLLPAGEIDVVVGEPLTDEPHEWVTYEGRRIAVETCAEIIAKKMYHRGQHARGRDLFDLCAVADGEPQAIDHARPFFARHGAAFLHSLKNSAYVEQEFQKIERIGYSRSFEECVALAELILA
ncbi:nucleotidyl transferase AbiEii/AbiGii toxin family protein [Ramlibacter sp. GTP1]|uniref:Nucleotidyl transferase AbiEii/AbiGii toxin family protein n=2 Tax=Ramlibacter albus TaxID=2079448 RepID=A0A923MDZ6_9BURK|nr:nucleotidyl transferase AbiEii/AbiGii toxin family protein [Ramlibacter albus]MBC5767282.1 nucleotidyl transferase AbiEii/AbiGii toxin family protein [Ramlibacter albus]